MIFLYLFFAGIFGHYLADYPLQGDYMSDAKHGKFTKDQQIFALFAHGLIQAACVTLAFFLVRDTTAGLLIPFISVGVTHIIIDASKAKYHLINFTTDQFLHLSVIAMVALAILLS